MDSVLTTDIKEYPLLSRGKVRDVYDLDDKLLIIATDRISAFDVVLPNGIPGRGKVLTGVSVFWFDYLKDIIDNHLISAKVEEYPKDLQQYKDVLEGRSMLVTRANRIDIECIVRGYISGSMWKEYKEAVKSGTTTVHGFEFPADMKESDKLAEAIFTPSTKAESGHDENISYEKMVDVVGNETAQLCRDKSLAIYTKAADFARKKGIIIADTKFEFGFVGDKLIVIDEVLTPDSSRFWPADEYEPGKSQPSFDKQIIRDYLDGLDWDKTPPGPKLPDEIVDRALARYTEVVDRLTG
ncbi:MAG: phosphoribosylaminoimidazolesuccinocarboxamide synthase [candidate division Zixibacteria bacterium]